jgi:hypothetical protein
LQDLEAIRTQFGLSGCRISNTYLTCPCTNETVLDQAFPYVIMKIGTFSSQVQLAFKGSAYMKWDGGSTCNSSFREKTSLANENYWIMGLPAYKAFDMLHDLDNNRIGFKAYNNSAV